MIKKFIFSILFLLLACKFLFAGAISVDAFISADDVTINHLETMRSTFQGAINSPDGALIQAGTINSNSLDANTTPVNRWNETFTDFVYTGLTIPTSASLVSSTVAGTAYVEGVRVVKEATPHTYGASKNTYVDLSKTGTYTYTAVATGASAPAVADNSIRLAMVSSDTTTITAVNDLRVTVASLDAEGISSIADTDGNTKIQTEKNSNEDIIRFDTAGTERVNIGSTGIVNISNLTASKAVVTDGSKNLVSATITAAQGGTGSTAAANAASGVVVLDANSKIPVAQLGTWAVKSADYAAQQAATDGFVVAYGVIGDSSSSAIFYSDVNANPSTVRGKLVNSGGITTYQNTTFPVKKSDYWKATVSGTAFTELVIYFIPSGS